MTAIYTITLDDLKEACFEIVKVLPYFKRKRITFSLTIPFLSIIFVLLPFFDFYLLYAVIPILMVIYYFYGYADILFTALKKQRYALGSENTKIKLTLKNREMIVEQSSIIRHIPPKAIVKTIEKEDKYILFLSKQELDFVIIKKTPENMSESEDERIRFIKTIERYLYS